MGMKGVKDRYWNATNDLPPYMLLTLENPVFGGYIFVVSVLILKMLFMSALTIVQRHRFKGVSKKIDTDDEEDGRRAEKPTRRESSDDWDPIERVRRAHLNDLENILPFMIMGLIFVCLNTPVMLALSLFRIHAAARLLHTIVCAFRPVPQPTPAIAFFLGYAVTIFMAVYAMYCTWINK